MLTKTLPRSRGLYIESLVATCNRNTVNLYDLSTKSFEEVVSRLDSIENTRGFVPGNDIKVRSQEDSLCVTRHERLSTAGSWIDVKCGSRWGNSCKKQCYCRCHNKPAFRFHIAPFKSFAGSLSLVFSGLTFAGQHCNVPACSNFGLSLVQVTYSLPRWLLSISVVGGVKVVHGYPSAGLIVRRRITQGMLSSSIIDLCRYSDTAECRAYLERYPESVHDVHEHDGATVLDYAFANKAETGRHGYENTGLMLAFGADPFVVDDYGRSKAIIELVILSAKRTNLTVHVQNVLPSIADLDKLEFSHLTKIILGYQPLNLQEELQKSQYCPLINQKDGTGLTPLHWAVRTGDSSAVQQLLDAGADPNILDPWNVSPLNRACNSRSSATCVEVLARAGADFTLRDDDGFVPLHTAAAAGQSNNILSLCIANGLTVNDVGRRHQDTPLARAAMKDQDDACKFLLRQGAQIDSEDWEGDTPLDEAIRGRSHRALRVLLSAGANLLHVTAVNRTILHKVAKSGDMTTIDIVSKTCLKGLDPEAKDNLGQTAYDYLCKRSFLPEGFIESFEQLIRSIKMINSKSSSPTESDEEEDDFVDVAEFCSLD